MALHNIHVLWTFLIESSRRKLLSNQRAVLGDRQCCEKRTTTRSQVNVLRTKIDVRTVHSTGKSPCELHTFCRCAMTVCYSASLSLQECSRISPLGCSLRWVEASVTDQQSAFERKWVSGAFNCPKASQRARSKALACFHSSSCRLATETMNIARPTCSLVTHGARVTCSPRSVAVQDRAGNSAVRDERRLRVAEFARSVASSRQHAGGDREEERVPSDSFTLVHREGSRAGQRVAVGQVKKCDAESSTGIIVCARPSMRKESVSSLREERDRCPCISTSFAREWSVLVSSVCSPRAMCECDSEDQEDQLRASALPLPISATMPIWCQCREKELDEGNRAWGGVFLRVAFVILSVLDVCGRQSVEWS